MSKMNPERFLARAMFSPYDNLSILLTQMTKNKREREKKKIRERRIDTIL